MCGSLPHPCGKVKHPRNTNLLRYAISDIHGCSKTFKLALSEINLQPTDELFLLGDYIDRGPDSQGVLEMIWDLEASGQPIVCLRGNHEEMVLEYVAGKRDRYEWFPQPELKQKTLNWFASLPHYHETPGYILVHAGLNFLHPEPLSDEYEMLWARYWYDDMVKNPDFLGDRIVIHGHTPAKMLSIRKSIQLMAENQYTCIDSGCSQEMEGMGYLTVLNLDTQEGTFVRCID